MNASNRMPIEALQTLMTLGVLGDWGDGRLLELYRSRRPGGDEAFDVLVRRHGPMVLAVCRAIAGPDEVDDAFQAVFLVLIRRADSIRKGDSVGPWLHGVAIRVARKARRSKARHASRFRVVDPVALASTAGRGPVPDESALIHAEIERLPERDRDALVHCALGGMTYDQAARPLGVSEPTLRGRLHRARKRLEARLRARGVSLPSPFLLPAPPAGLIDAVLAIGRGTAPSTPAMTSTFAKGAILAMASSPLKLAAGATLAVLVGTLGVLGTMVVVAWTSPPPLEFRSPPPAPLPFSMPEPPFPPVTPPEPIGPPGLTSEQVESRNRSIWAVLATPMDFDYPNGISIEAFLGRIKEGTAKGDDPGVPIYVEPAGLLANSVELRTEWPVVSKGKPLAETLKAYLGAMGLGYAVESGFLRIDSRAAAAEYRLQAIEVKLDRLIEQSEARDRAAPR